MENDGCRVDGNAVSLSNSLRIPCTSERLWMNREAGEAQNPTLSLFSFLYAQLAQT